MSSHREPRRESQSRPRRLACLVLLAAVVLPGCGMFQPAPRRQPETVAEWMRQPRVGEAPKPEDKEE